MQYQSIYNRLRRVEGQIRGLEKMISAERPTSEILTQLLAAKSSLSSTVTAFTKSMLARTEGPVELSEASLDLLLKLIGD